MLSRFGYFTSVRKHLRHGRSLGRAVGHGLRLRRSVLASVIGFFSITALGAGVDRPLRSVDVQHCQVYVEKAGSLFGIGDRTSLRFYLRVNPGMMDGDVVAVGFYGRKDDVSHACNGFSVLSNPLCAGVNSWEHYFGRPMNSVSDNTYEVQLEVADIDGNFFDHEGVFFAQTAAGTRYWLHPSAGQQNFFFSQDFVEATVGADCSFLGHQFDLRYLPSVNESHLPGLETGCM